jgi:protein-L-isoaspartate(D-aspartate) O-methyltransferase
MRGKVNKIAIEGIGMTSRRTRDRLIERLIDQGVKSHAVLDVMRSTPRHLFLDEALSHRAYEDVALPIGHNQTISQPYIVAKMSELLLAAGRPKNILEVGTGSGYQTSILAQLTDKVYSIERIKSLQWQAKRCLRAMDLHNVAMKHGDGWLGWQSKAPFEAIIVTAAPTSVPPALLEQLADGGCLIIPVGEKTQVLKIITRNGDIFDEQQVEAVRFVPLVAGDLL